MVQTTPLKALVLAGGRGTRLRPLTYTLPKQLVPVANRPILHYVLDQIAAMGIREVGVILSPETGDQIRASLEANPWHFEFTYIVQPEPLGLAHAVQTASPYLEGSPFLMYLGDNLLEDSLAGLADRFLTQGLDALLLVKEVEDPRKFGVVVLDDQQRLVDLVEKPKEPPSSLALVGVYFFSPKILEMVKGLTPSWRGEYEITDAIRRLLHHGGRIEVVPLQGWWLDTGKKDDLLLANRRVLETLRDQDIAGTLEGRCVLDGPVVIEPGSRLRNARITGPVVIGKEAVLEESEIGPFVSVGPGCRIRSARIRGSVLMEAVTVEAASLHDSLIGTRAVIRGTGTSHPQLKLLVGDDIEIVLE